MHPTDARLTAIRQRFDAIIPGPWRWFGNTATDQIYLGTVDRGRLIILEPHTRATEHVFHHDHCETYALAEARENVINWCGAHEGDPTFREDLCKCDEIRDFLGGEMDPRDPYDKARDLTNDKGHVWLSRAVAVDSDMLFAAPEPRDAERLRRSRGATRLASYREFARYEVLGKLPDEGGRFHQYATRAENPDGNLYREDFMSLATPEAEFIEHAPEDIAWLLERVGELEAALGTLREPPNQPPEQEEEHDDWSVRRP